MKNEGPSPAQAMILLNIDIYQIKIFKTPPLIRVYFYSYSLKAPSRSKMLNCITLN